MKTMLECSVGLNVVLLGCLFFVVKEKQIKPVESIQPFKLTQPVSSAPVANALPHATPAPFRWSQLDGSNYHDYIKNLRAAGCPAPTLLAIVTADVDAVYQKRGQDLEKKLADLENSLWSTRLASAGTEQAIKDEMSKLPDEETAMIDNLLGLQPATTAIAAAQTVPQKHPAPAATPPSMPYVLLNDDLSSLNLSADQQQMIAGLRQDFLNQIGGVNQDPNDPAYLARWQKAQAYEDSLLQGMLGEQVYTKFQTLQLQAENQGSKDSRAQ